MGRGLASLIMGLSLLVATASWSGFILSRTVLDPGRSERLADTLLDNEEVRDAISNRLADAIEVSIPADVAVARPAIESAADVALEDPRVEELIRDGIVRSHQNALNGVDEPVTIDASALGAAGRDAIVDIRPELDVVLPAAPPLAVELPSSGLTWLGAVKDYVDRFTVLGASMALIGIAAAFTLARNRPAALRRVAFWSFGASAFWLVVAFAIPKLLEQIAPSSVAIAMAAIDVFFGAMITPAVMMAALGVGLLLISFGWPAITRRQPAAMLDRGAPRRPAATTYRQAPGQAGYGVAPRQPSQPVASHHTPAHHHTPAEPASPYPEYEAATRVYPQVSSSRPPEPPRAQPPQPPAAPSHTPTEVASSPYAETQRIDDPRHQGWVEGVGYVDDADTSQR